MFFFTSSDYSDPQQGRRTEEKKIKGFMTSIEASREGKRDKRVEREKEKIESIRQDEGSGREHTIAVGVQMRKRMDKDQV